MPKTTEDDLAGQPFARRRGAWTTWGCNRWDAVLVDGPIEEVTRRLSKAPGVGVVHGDVRQELVNGKLPVPDGDWFLLVEIKGSAWVHALSNTGDFDFGRRLSRLVKRRVLQTGHEDTAGFAYVHLYHRNRCGLKFESNQSRPNANPDHNDADESTTLVGRAYPKRWLDQFEETADAHQALIRDLDAYVPMLQALPEDNRLTLIAGHEDAADPKHIAAAALVLLGEKRPRGGSAANLALLNAILSEDVAAAKAALNGGASLKTIPRFRCTPLGRALSHWKKKPAESLKVVEALLEAGADPNDGGPNSPPPIFVAIEGLQQEFRAGFIDALANAGANLDRYHEPSRGFGWTPLHAAVSDTNDAAVRALLNHGADPLARNSQGKTPREFLVERRAFVIEFLGPEGSKKRVTQLKEAERMLIEAERLSETP
ncbi:MAG: ankyrin repeat domain-containing protein [Planctomycetota bacterium]